MKDGQALTFNYGFKFEDLFEPQKLKELTEEFYNYFKEADTGNYERFAKYRDAKGESYSEIETSKILIEAARYQGNFLAEFFNVKTEVIQLKADVDSDRAILKVKSDFIMRRVFKKFKPQDADSLNFENLNSEVDVIKKLL